MRTNYEPLIIQNHNAKIDFLGFVFALLFVVFICVVAKAEFIMLAICFVVTIFLAIPIYRDFVKYNNSYFKFTHSSVKLIKDEKILDSFELNSLAKITKIPQMSIKQRQNKSKILSFLSRITSIFIIFVLALLFWGLNLQDFFKFGFVFFAIILFLYLFYAIPQSIYQIFISKFRFFKFANSLEIKMQDGKSFFIVFATFDEYDGAREYFLQTLNLDINDCEVKYF